MITEDEARFVKGKVEETIKASLDLGAPHTPTTMLERHAFELGRLSVLKWICPDPPVEPTAGQVALEELRQTLKTTLSEK